jgi:type IV fimbrial biogenesis protein FimT
MRNLQPRTTRGASLVEMLAALAVAAVLGSLVVPPLLAIVERGRGAADVNAIVGSIQLARMHAVTAAASTTLCPSANGSDCGTDWRSGHVVFVDTDADGQRDAGERIVHVAGPIAAGASLRFRAFRARPWLQFTPRGFTRAQNGTFLYCPASGSRERARAVVVNAIGRVRIAGDRDGDGIVELPGGDQPDCGTGGP